ncbi:nucleolar complex protein [Xylariaceae sp. FL0255]|nr:nucleolar complex protein [Xylariaceae sp. FL0255]
MPGKTAPESLKRKRAKIPEKASKRPKPESSDEDEGDDPQAEILFLEDQILQSKKHYNNINTLLERAKNIEDEDTALLATVSLCRVFLRLLASGNLSRKVGQSDKDATVLQWLKTRLSEYRKLLVTSLGHEASASTALTLVMRLIKAENQNVAGRADVAFPKDTLKEIVGAIIQHGFEDVQQEFCEKYFGAYADVRYYTFQVLSDILSEHETSSLDDEMFDNVFDMLSFFEEVPSSAEDIGELYVQLPKKKSDSIKSLQQQKKQSQAAWLALMKLNPNRQQRKKLLEIMADSIAPWFTQPERLMDFLTDSYNAGGSASLLALSGVFYLIQHRNLDYPSFYQKLYSLLDPEILHSKHRSKFLRLLDTFLASTHLPAALVASFIKKLTRLCLNAPPAAIVSIIPLCYNLFKKHPLCTFMMHRVPRTPEEKITLESEGMDDPFNEDEQDPTKTGAIDSCVWEVVQLQSHYHPNVATIAKIVSEQFTKQWYNLEDFLDHSYSSVSHPLSEPAPGSAQLLIILSFSSLWRPNYLSL